MHRTPVTIAERTRQKETYFAGPNDDDVALGFAALFLNRVNRSGIIETGGVIGGVRQNGANELDFCLDKADIETRIRRIAAHAPPHPLHRARRRRVSGRRCRRDAGADARLRRSVLRRQGGRALRWRVRTPRPRGLPGSPGRPRTAVDPDLRRSPRHPGPLRSPSAVRVRHRLLGAGEAKGIGAPRRLDGAAHDGGSGPPRRPPTEGPGPCASPAASLSPQEDATGLRAEAGPVTPRAAPGRPAFRPPPRCGGARAGRGSRPTRPRTPSARGAPSGRGRARGAAP